jgi:hypothetical protein
LASINAIAFSCSSTITEWHGREHRYSRLLDRQDGAQHQYGATAIMVTALRPDGPRNGFGCGGRQEGNALKDRFDMAFLHAFSVGDFVDTLISLFAAFVLGTLIGAERRYRRRGQECRFAWASSTRRISSWSISAARSASALLMESESWFAVDVFEPKTTTPPNSRIERDDAESSRHHQNSAEAHGRLRRQGRFPAPFQRIGKFLDLHFEFGDLLPCSFIHAGWSFVKQRTTSSQCLLGGPFSPARSTFR